MAKTTAVRQPMTKAQLLSAISEETGLTRKQVTDVMDSLSGQIQRHIQEARTGHVHPSEPVEDQDRAQAGEEGSKGYQSVYGRGNDICREACPYRRQDSAAEGPQGHGRVASVLMIAAVCRHSEAEYS